MAIIDPDLPQLGRAGPDTAERSNRAVLDPALRRLIASRKKGALIDGIARLTDLEYGLGAPVISSESQS
ncbi:DUF2191 domain-containing protein [Nocardia sp. NEAU-351]|uniref:DUF2191 domain-containing protein n=1 Tax=Nocardia bovistercoris TaxID=2785916 RepID=A0A931I8P0_9NOCA|nr:DUF2191 domain-containing protein [Nocardia bovistercoris]